METSTFLHYSPTFELFLDIFWTPHILWQHCEWAISAPSGVTYIRRTEAVYAAVTTAYRGSGRNFACLAFLLAADNEPAQDHVAVRSAFVLIRDFKGSGREMVTGQDVRLCSWHCQPLSISGYC